MQVQDGGGGPIEVTPGEFAAAGGSFAAGQTRLDEIVSALLAALGGIGGMSGGDSAGEAFARRYDPAARATVRAFSAGIRTTGGVAEGLVATANNFARAEQHSNAGPAAAGTDTYAAPLVYTDVYYPEPPTAAGGHVAGVNRLIARFWPQGDPDKLRRAAAAWRAAGSALDALGQDLHGVVAGVTAYNQAPSVAAFAGLWAQVWGGSGSGTMGSAVRGCAALAAACDRMASTIESCHHKLEALLTAAGIALGLGIGFAAFTFGASAAAAAEIEAGIAADAAVVAAEFGVEVAAEVELAIEAELVPLLEEAAAAAPTITMVEAETAQVATQLEQELLAAEEKIPTGVGGRGGSGGGRGGRPPTGGSGEQPPSEGDPAPYGEGTGPPDEPIATPQVADSRLQHIINNLFKGVNSPGRVGNGTTADAIRSERATGQPTGARWHTVKGRESVRALRAWLRRNPVAPQQERTLAQYLLDDLLDAIGG